MESNYPEDYTDDYAAFNAVTWCNLIYAIQLWTLALIRGYEKIVTLRTIRYCLVDYYHSLMGHQEYFL